MPFQLPSLFQKDLAPSTQHIYKTKLNALAKKGFDTVEILVEKQSEVIEAIKSLTEGEDNEKTRNIKRYFLSAIFWAAPIPKDNEYYRFWQAECLPLKISGTETKWSQKI